MNKKILIAASLAVVSFMTLTAFKTREQQQAEITQAVTMQLEAYRTQLTEACDTRVTSEAQSKYDMMVAEAEAAATKPGATPMKKPGKGTAKGPRVEPLPQPTKTDPQKDRGGAIKPGDAEQQKERGGAVKPGDAESQKKRGGAVKQGGGN